MAETTLKRGGALFNYMSLPITAHSPTARPAHSTRLSEESSRSSLRFIDGRPARVHVVTFGCSHNQSDSEHIAGVLQASGYALAETVDSADIVVVNSCTVKGPSQDSFLHLVRSLRGSVPLVVAGCVPQGDPNHPDLAGVSIIGVQQISRADEAVAATLDGMVVRMLGKEALPSLDLPVVRRNPYVEIISINAGCLHACAYCKTKHARGHLRSHSIESIVSRARRAIDDGVLEIWLTSEDVGAYGRDIGVTIIDLLDALLPILPAPVMLRIGMANPPHIEGCIEAFAAALNHPRVYAFAHLPVQSGSDAVLASMCRGYTVERFQSVVDRLRVIVPHATIATDIICGFPTETEGDFAMTASLVTRNAFPVLNISQFYPRPGTPAAALALLPTQEVKRRSRIITALFRSQRPYDALMGAQCDVWVTSLSDDGLRCLGHTRSYVPVLLAKDDSLLGACVRVRVVRAGKHFVEGALIDVVARVMPRRSALRRSAV